MYNDFNGVDFMKPIIGVLPLYDKEKESIWMLPLYLDGIKRAGGIPVILPYQISDCDLIELDKMIDGYLFTGGDDINPKLYKEEASEYVTSYNDIRDSLEARIYKIAKDNDKAILGICRGIQIINVLEGGSLYQDLDTYHPSKVNHKNKGGYHKVFLLHNSPLSDLVDDFYIEVNTLHHQGVKRIAQTLKGMAVSEDGIVEALYHPKMKFIWAVQWHPEYMLENKVSQKLFEIFILKAMEKKED